MSHSILIVDDEENARLALSRLLVQDGYLVESADGGESALEVMAQKSFQLVISDINMPGMNGMLFLREINRRYPETAVIMMTAYGEIESYVDAMELGAFEYLHKPVRSDELKVIIRRLFHLIGHNPGHVGVTI